MSLLFAHQACFCSWKTGFEVVGEVGEGGRGVVVVVFGVPEGVPGGVGLVTCFIYLFLLNLNVLHHLNNYIFYGNLYGPED